MAGPRIVLLAGEASGDQHGAHLAQELRKRWPHARLSGLGGPLMDAEGVDVWEGLDRLAVMGFVEVIRHLRFFRALEKRVKDELDRGADLVIPIDYPGFNLRIAKAAHKKGIPVLYYIAPKVWAWKMGRAQRLAEVTRGIAVIFPFETEIFQRFGAEARFVGHPLLEESVPDVGRDPFCGRHGLDPELPILALFPGSRRQEVERHLAIFLAAASLLRKTMGPLQVVVSRASGLTDAPGFDEADAVVDDSRLLLRHSRAAIVKSGTSTLQATLEGVPFVTVYRTSPITYALARRLVTLDHFSLPNLVAGRRVVSELIQEAATPERIAAELVPLWELSGPLRDEMIDDLSRVRDDLGEVGAANRVAQWAEEILSG